MDAIASSSTLKEPLSQTAVSTTSTERKKRRVRHRTRHIRKWIISKLEFLFAEPNWRRDYYLQALSEQSPDKGVAVEEILKFASFNKYEPKLSANYVAQVLRQDGSNVVKLSSDEQRICHKVVPVAKENVNDCTIFVDRLPATADLTWMHKQFGRYGKIDYVKLPKKSHRFPGPDHKIFSFVEFDKPECAVLATKAFNQSSSSQGPTTSADNAAADAPIITSHISPASRKRQRTQSEGTGIATAILSPPKTKAKRDEPSSDSSVGPSTSTQEAAVMSTSTTAGTESKKKRHHRKRKHRKSRRRGHHMPKSLRGVKVFSYSDYEKLKKQYKAIQKTHAAKARRQLVLHRNRAKRAESGSSVDNVAANLNTAPTNQNPMAHRSRAKRTHSGSSSHTDVDAETSGISISDAEGGRRNLVETEEQRIRHHSSPSGLEEPQMKRSRH